MYTLKSWEIANLIYYEDPNGDDHEYSGKQKQMSCAEHMPSSPI